MRREGRLTPAQARALNTLWSRYGIDHDAVLDPVAVFGRQAPLVVEIGFGNGEALLAAAREHPEVNYLGIEVHRPGIGRLLRELNAAGLGHVRVMAGDAAEILRERIGTAMLDGVHILFPDPWPKKRHHKRRLIDAGFAAVLAQRLKPGAYLHLATDWEDYARQMLAVLEAEEALVNTAGAGGYVPRPATRPQTRFERRGERLGHRVFDLLFVRR